MIYEMALVRDRPLQIYKIRTTSKPCEPATSVKVAELVEPGLLRTCHATRQEASPIWYGRNIFSIRGPCGMSLSRDEHSLKCDGDLASWLARIGPESRAHLRKVYMDDNFYDIERVDDRLAACRELLASKGMEIDHARIFVECDLGEDDSEDEDDDEEDEDSESEGEGEESDEEDEERYKWLSSSDSTT